MNHKYCCYYSRNQGIELDIHHFLKKHSQILKMERSKLLSMFRCLGRSSKKLNTRCILWQLWHKFGMNHRMEYKLCWCLSEEQCKMWRKPHFRQTSLYSGRWHHKWEWRDKNRRERYRPNTNQKLNFHRSHPHKGWSMSRYIDNLKDNMKCSRLMSNKSCKIRHRLNINYHWR